jgi:hypothetical protein
MEYPQSLFNPFFVEVFISDVFFSVPRQYTFRGGDVKDVKWRGRLWPGNGEGEVVLVSVRWRNEVPGKGGKGDGHFFTVFPECFGVSILPETSPIIR